MKYILATKTNMLSFFDEKGNAYAATLLKATPSVVTQVKTVEKDGYEAIQLGFGSKKKVVKPLRGHFKEKGNFRYVKEFRDGNGSHNVGDAVAVSIFKEGDMVTVSGTSKGKGFAGVVKRYGFKGGPRSHGQKHSEREPGSIGGGGRAGGRVVKGMRMAGRMGGDRITVKNVRVLAVDPQSHELFVSGAVPGRRGTLLEIRQANS